MLDADSRELMDRGWAVMVLLLSLLWWTTPFSPSFAVVD